MLKKILFYKEWGKGKIMIFLEKIKKEPRMIFAIVNFISFFLPWITINITGNMLGEIYGDAYTVSGFGLVNEGFFGIVFYIIPVVIFIIPLISQLKRFSRYLYLILSVIAIIMMLIIKSLLKAGTGALEMDFGWGGVEMDIDRKIGYWIALVCNIGMIIYTLRKDYHITSGEELKKNIKDIKVDNITEQVSNIAKDLGDSVQQTLFVECPNCGNRVVKGKKFCSKCGTQLLQENETTEEKNVKCTVCGKIVSYETKFCPECGAKIVHEQERKCSQCGRKLNQSDKFCPQCGTKVEG